MIYMYILKNVSIFTCMSNIHGLLKIRQYTSHAAAKSPQSCPTLRDPIDGSPPGSPVPGLLQARTLEWVAIAFSNACKWKVKVKSPSRVRLFTTPWTAAHQAPPSMGFSRQEYWSGVPLPSLTHLIPLKNSLCCKGKKAEKKSFLWKYRCNFQNTIGY